MGAQPLDLTGPTEVFSMASRLRRAARYEVVLASPRGGSIVTSSGLSMQSVRLETLTPRASDTVLVSGGEDEGVAILAKDTALLRWLRRAAQVSRLGSVCTGAFVLAAAGTLDGLRAATHWSACDRLQAFRPAVRVDPQAIFVQTGRIWTSAGVTTGIAMALAMLEEAHGRALADAVASQLVLCVRRPSLKQVADRAGLRDVPQMNRAFQRTLGLLPRDVLLLFAESASPRE
jgi:transcriptional regulator GlxA family with amidase domain